MVKKIKYRFCRYFLLDENFNPVFPKANTAERAFLKFAVSPDKNVYSLKTDEYIRPDNIIFLNPVAAKYADYRDFKFIISGDKIKMKVYNYIPCEGRKLIAVLTVKKSKDKKFLFVREICRNNILPGSLENYGVNVSFYVIKIDNEKAYLYEEKKDRKLNIICTYERKCLPDGKFEFMVSYVIPRVNIRFSFVDEIFKCLFLFDRDNLLKSVRIHGIAGIKFKGRMNQKETVRIKFSSGINIERSNENCIYNMYTSPDIKLKHIGNKFVSIFWNFMRNNAKAVHFFNDDENKIVFYMGIFENEPSFQLKNEKEGGTYRTTFSKKDIVYERLITEKINGKIHKRSIYMSDKNQFNYTSEGNTMQAYTYPYLFMNEEEYFLNKKTGCFAECFSVRIFKKQIDENGIEKIEVIHPEKGLENIYFKILNGLKVTIVKKDKNGSVVWVTIKRYDRFGRLKSERVRIGSSAPQPIRGKAYEKKIIIGSEGTCSYYDLSGKPVENFEGVSKQVKNGLRNDLFCSYDYYNADGEIINGYGRYFEENEDFLYEDEDAI